MQDNSCNKTPRNYLFGSLLTGVYDVNRNQLLKKNDFTIIEKWYHSILKFKMHAIVFHNTFSKDIVAQYSNEFIQFIEVDYDERLNPNVQRYFLYQEYVKQHAIEISNLFVTDISDVEVTSNPFESVFFLKNSDKLFCGDEDEILDNNWMYKHCTHLRNLMPEFSKYEAINKNKTLLNCGIIGGSIGVMEALFDKMTALHEAYSFTNQTDYTLDMGVFNYAARTFHANKILHGEPINTIFKKYESERTDCWFRHK